MLTDYIQGLSNFKVTENICEENIIKLQGSFDFFIITFTIINVKFKCLF